MAGAVFWFLDLTSKFQLLTSNYLPMEQQLEQIATELVGRAMRAGATAADATVLESDEFSTALRLGEIEKLKEAASKALGLRIFLGVRSASSFSSDFSAIIFGAAGGAHPGDGSSYFGRSCQRFA